MSSAPNIDQDASQGNLVVEIPTMKSLFVEMFYGDTLLSSGTGFLIAKDRQSHCAFITNRHNITGRDQDTGKCLSSMGAIPDHIVIYFHKNEPQIGSWLPIRLPLYRPDGTPFWIEHPVFKGTADVVALNLRWGSDVTKLPYYLGTELDRPGIVISPAETVSVIGFPFGLSSAGKFPIWSTGFLAQELSLVTKENPVFLIDCRTRQGQSGSAVIAHRPNGSRKLQNDKIVISLNPINEWELLGIYSGRVNRQSDLGRVWHVSILQALLDAAEFDMTVRSKSTEASNGSGT